MMVYLSTQISGLYVMLTSLFSSEPLSSTSGAGSLTSQHLSGNRRLALYRLTLLRVLILSFALSAWVFDYFVLSRGLPFKPFLIIIGIGFTYSALSYIRIKKNLLVTDPEIFIHLVLDSLLILALVSISGTTANPFIYYLLVLVAINAVLFEKRASWSFSIFTIMLYTLLLYFDIKDHASHALNDFQLHLIGMWVNFVGSTVIINFFISRLSTALRDREILLAQARENNLKNEQLIGIGTIAASTVHALRTPLSTIAVLLSDLKSDHQSAEFVADIDLLLRQVDRCKETTDKLASLADIPENENQVEKPEELFLFLKEHYLLTHQKITPEFKILTSEHSASIQKNILLRQAIMNLIDNAIHAAKQSVVIHFEIIGKHLIIKIHDDGAGIPREIIENWGKPFLSKKEGGLGIGIFLANSTIERLGGKVILHNVTLHKGNDQSGTTIEVSIPTLENTH